MCCIENQAVYAFYQVDNLGTAGHICEVNLVALFIGIVEKSLRGME